MRICLLLILAFAQLNLFAQESSKKQLLSIGIGSHHTSVQDKVFSPLVYRGSGFTFDLNYLNTSDRRAHELAFGLGSQSLSPALNPQSESTVRNDVYFLNFDYLRKLQFKKQSHSIGLGWYNFLSARNYQFLVEDDISLDIFTSLNLVYAYPLSIKQNQNLRFKFSYPLAAYVAGRMRIPNDFSEDVFQEIVEDPESLTAGKVLRSGDFLSINKFSDFRFNLNYFIELSDQIGFGADYNFQYYNYPKYRQVKNGGSQFLVRITYLF